jgi:hypothetical protein
MNEISPSICTCVASCWRVKDAYGVSVFTHQAGLCCGTVGGAASAGIRMIMTVPNSKHHKHWRPCALICMCKSR